MPRMLPLVLLAFLMVNVAFSLFMLHVINKTFTARAAELAAIPDDDEVMQLEANTEATKRVRKELTRFDCMPAAMRGVLGGGTALLMLATYWLLFFPSTLFQPFTLTDCKDDLGRDRPYDFVPTLGASRTGISALLCLLIAVGLRSIFNSWAGSAVSKHLAKVEPVHSRSGS